ncbi:MAG: metallophosphoesterase [Clostridiales bacterium]|jgi:hypothetical protein|nr:metallophosphoesterase [Clostridiales bacterium]
MEKKKAAAFFKRALGFVCVTIIALTLVSGAYLSFFFIVHQPVETGAREESADFVFDINALNYMDVGDDGSFSIMLLSDLHMTFGAAVLRDKKTYDGISKALETQNPDLVIVNGDAWATPLNLPSLTTFADFMESKRVYWAYAFGNHDSEFGFSKTRLVNKLKEYEYCVFDEGPKNITGNSNYFINLRKGGDIVYTLSIIDSNEYVKYRKIYDYVHADQMEWFGRTLDAIRAAAGGIVPVSVFQHIPVPEFKEVYDSLLADGYFDTHLSDKGVYSPDYNSGFLSFLEAAGGVDAMFFAHDHYNDFGGYAPGSSIYMQYGYCSGYMANLTKELDRGVTMVYLGLGADGFLTLDPSRDIKHIMYGEM